VFLAYLLLTLAVLESRDQAPLFFDPDEPGGRAFVGESDGLLLGTYMEIRLDPFLAIAANGVWFLRRGRCWS
jgi:hypothetical protein